NNGKSNSHINGSNQQQQNSNNGKSNSHINGSNQQQQNSNNGNNGSKNNGQGKYNINNINIEEEKSRREQEEKDLEAENLRILNEQKQEEERLNRDQAKEQAATLKRQNKYKGPDQKALDKALIVSLEKVNLPYMTKDNIGNNIFSSTKLFTIIENFSEEPTENKLNMMLEQSDRFKNFYTDKVNNNLNNNLEGKEYTAYASKLKPLALWELRYNVALLQNLGKDGELRDFTNYYRYKNVEIPSRKTPAKEELIEMQKLIDKLNTKEYLGQEGTWEDINSSNFKKIFEFVKTILDVKSSFFVLKFIKENINTISKRTKEKERKQEASLINKLKRELKQMNDAKRKEKIESIKNKYEKDIAQEIEDYFEILENKKNEFFKQYKTTIDEIIDASSKTSLFKYINTVNKEFEDLEQKVNSFLKDPSNSFEILVKQNLKLPILKKLYTYLDYLSPKFFGSLDNDMKKFKTDSQSYLKIRDEIIKGNNLKDIVKLREALISIKPYKKRMIIRQNDEKKKQDMNKSATGFKNRIKADEQIYQQFVDLRTNLAATLNKIGIEKNKKTLETTLLYKLRDFLNDYHYDKKYQDALGIKRQINEGNIQTNELDDNQKNYSEIIKQFKLIEEDFNKLSSFIASVEYKHGIYEFRKDLNSYFPILEKSIEEIKKDLKTAENYFKKN
ncbi:MAG: hypothetical protein GY830_05610, partial [Bacteroidetes bacterium]|nr:hypothetical protein [Bacteroidota bacterium]